MLRLAKDNIGEYLAGIYVCEKLYETCNYDLLRCSDDDLLKNIKSTTTSKDIDTELKFEDKIIPVTIILWIEPIFNNLKGMVISKDDKEGYKLAKEKQKNRE